MQGNQGRWIQQNPAIPIANPGVNAGRTLANQTGRRNSAAGTTITETSNNTTIIRPSPGTTMDVIIRSAGSDATDPPGVMSSTGRTPVTTFPTNKRKLSNVQEFNTFETPGGPLAQRVPLASSRVTRLPEQPLDRTLGFRMENQEIGQNLLLKGQPLYVVASPPKGPSPYNFQNQRNPLPGIRSEVFNTMPNWERNDQDANTNAMGEPVSNAVFGLNMIEDSYRAGLSQAILDIQALGDDGTKRSLKNSIGLHILANTEHIFIQPASYGEFTEASFTTENKYNLMDSFGNRIFYAFERTTGRDDCCSACCGSDSRLGISVVAAGGVECVSIRGSTGVAVMQTPGSNSPFAFIVEEQRPCSAMTRYAIKDKRGNLCFKILREHLTSAQTEMEVFGNDMVRIGRVGQFWGHLPDSPVDMSRSYGISFPKNMNIEEKTMMMGALLTIYWKYFADTKLEAKLCMGAWFGLCCCVLVILLIILGFAFLAAYLIHPSSTP